LSRFIGDFSRTRALASHDDPAGWQALPQRGEEFMNIRSGLAAGVFAAVAVAASGCSSSGSSTPSGNVTGSAVAATGTTSANPSWAAGLGPAVTVVPPTSATAGNGSPQAVVTGVATVEDSGNYTSVCTYYAPNIQSECKSQVSAEVSASPSAMASQVGTIKNLAIGYTAIRGNQALVGATGTFCASGKCSTNTDPAALFSSGKTFSALWAEADNQNASVYSLAACTKVDGKWYLYQPASS
jgi:hypothetical protein